MGHGLLHEEPERLTAESQIMTARPVLREVAGRCAELIATRAASPVTVAPLDLERVGVFESRLRAARRPLRVGRPLSGAHFEQQRVRQDRIPFTFPLSLRRYLDH